jgi:hypothetical protein
LAATHEVILRKLQAHSSLNSADIAAIRALPHTERCLRPNEDIVRQGDKPNAAVVVMQDVGSICPYTLLAICLTLNRSSSKRWITPSARLAMPSSN